MKFNHFGWLNGAAITVLVAASGFEYFRGDTQTMFLSLLALAMVSISVLSDRKSGS